MQISGAMSQWQTSPETQSNDTQVIVVFGATGTGKSTFIKHATEHADNLVVECASIVGDRLRSHTREVQAYTCKHHDDPTRNVTFVDTPGFDDTTSPDPFSETLEKVATYLERSYRKGQKVAGILYFHRISDNRMGNNPLASLEVFRKLCGYDALSHVVMVTTMWDLVENDVGKKRGCELEGEYWSAMMKGGSRHKHFALSSLSAWMIVNDLPRVATTLAIQIQLVDEGLPFTRTVVGLLVSKWQDELAEAFRRVIRKFKSSTGHANAEYLLHFVAMEEIDRLRAHLEDSPGSPLQHPGSPNVHEELEVDERTGVDGFSKPLLPRTGDSRMSPLHAIVRAISVANTTCYGHTPPLFVCELADAAEYELDGTIDEDVIALARSTHDFMLQVYEELNAGPFYKGPGITLSLLNQLRSIVDELYISRESFLWFWPWSGAVTRSQQDIQRMSDLYETWSGLNYDDSVGQNGKGATAWV